jgi:hypothetical protein
MAAFDPFLPLAGVATFHPSGYSNDCRPVPIQCKMITVLPPPARSACGVLAPLIGGTHMRLATVTATLSLLLSAPSLADPVPATPADAHWVLLWMTEVTRWNGCSEGFSTDWDPVFEVSGKGTQYYCREAGPFQSGGHAWWIQVVGDNIPNVDDCSQKNESICHNSFIRVCSLAFRRADSQPPPGKGPCRSTKGVGPKGCEVCAASEDYAGRPGG